MENVKNTFPNYNFALVIPAESDPVFIKDCMAKTPAMPIFQLVRLYPDKHMNANIQKSTFDFLSKLKRNNNREWFQKNKEDYLRARADVSTWVEGLIHAMNRHDRIQTTSAKDSLRWIYNDVRFSEDKTPYN